VALTEDERRTAARQLLLEAGGGERRFRARGASMSPLIRPGDELRWRPVGSREPEVGEVIVFERAGALVAHRLIARRGSRRFLEKGDASLVAGVVEQREILGRVTAVERAGGRLLRLDSSRWRRLGKILARFGGLVARLPYSDEPRGEERRERRLRTRLARAVLAVPVRAAMRLARRAGG